MSPGVEDRKLIYGTESFKSAKDVLSEAGSKHPIIVTTPFYSTTGAYRKFLESLDVPFQEFNEITSGPPMPEVEHLAEAYRNKECDHIISYGNSSVIWASKLLKFYFAHDAHLLVVPTTLTVSTFSDWAEFRLGDEVKYVVDTSMVPDAVILDPEPTLETEGDLWYSSGLSVMDYAMANMMRGEISPETEDLLLSSLESLAINLPGRSLESRLEALLSTWYSKVDDYDILEDKLTKIRSVLKARLDLPDEAVSALMLPVSAYYCVNDASQRMAGLAIRLGFKGENISDLALKSYEMIQGLIRKLGIPQGLGTYGIPLSEIRDVVVDLELNSDARDSIISSIFS